MFMLKKYLLPGCVIAALTACGGGQDLTYGPANDSIPDDPPPVPEFTPEWFFTDESDMDDWTIEWNKPGSGDAEDSEIYWHDTQYALGIKPHWGGESVAKNDNITVYGTLAEPVDLAFGTIYLSLYYTRESLGNPWGTNPYWGNSAHHIGTQYLVIDSDGNRALLDTGNGGNWMNSFDIGNPNNNKWIRTDEEARGNETGDDIDDLAQGYWFDLAIKVGDERGLEPDVHFFPDDENAGDVDFTSIVSVGVVMQYALEFADRNTDPVGYPQAAEYWEQFEGASERYFYIDAVALVPGEQPPPPPVEPPPSLDESPGFGLPIYREELESGFNDVWGGQGATADFESAYGAKSEDYAIALEFEGAGSRYLIGGPDQTLDLTAFNTLDFSVWVDFENEQDSMKLWISLCDCDDGIEVTVNKESWNNISLAVEDFGKDSLFGALAIKNNSAAGGTIYIDDFGFDKVPDISQPAFDLPVYYEDALESGFNKYDGWGGTYNFGSTTRFRTGETSMELAYTGGYGTSQIDVAGDAGLDISEQVIFHLSAYLAAGGETSTLLVQLCNPGNSIGCGDNDGVQVTVVAGEWTDFSMPISSFPDIAGLLGEIRIKNYTDGDKTIYVDNVGFDANVPTLFELPIYGDGLAAGFGMYNGWGGAYDFASTNVVETGATAIELLYSGGYGTSQIDVDGDAGLDISGQTNYQFAAYFDAAEGSTTLLLQLCNPGNTEGCGDNDGVQVTVPAGRWTRYSLPISDFPDIGNLVGEFRIKNYTDSDKAVYIDNIGFDKVGPALEIPVYYDALSSGFAQWAGWGGTYTAGVADYAYHGYKGIELAYTGGYGSMQIDVDGDAGLDISGVSTFHISAFMPEGDVATTTLLMQLCNPGNTIGCGDNDGVQLTVTAGQWNAFEVPITDFPDTGDLVGEMRIKNYTDSDKTVYVDYIGFSD